MLRVLGSPKRFCDGLTRRDMLVARLERTGRTISIGRYLAISLIVAGIFALAATLATTRGWNTLVPHLGQTVELS